MTRTTPPSVAGMILSPAERARALTASLRDGPDLTGAACKGMAPLFDDHIDGETHEDTQARMVAARAVCARCPILATCRSAADGMDETLKAGMWAGDAYEHRETRRIRESRKRARTAEPP